MTEEGTETTLSFERQIAAIVRGDGDLAAKRASLDEFHDFELSQTLPLLDLTDRKRFYRILDVKTLADVFEHLDPEEAVVYIKELAIAEAGKILNGMEGDDLVDLIQAFPTRDERVTYLALLQLEKRNSIKTMIDYDDTVVGSIMNNVYLQIPRTITVKQAIKTMVDVAEQTEFINNLYVVENGILVGVLSLKEVIAAGNRPDRSIEDLMTVNLITVQPTTKIETAIGVMRDYDFLLLPVVDDGGRMLGIISFDDMFEAMNDESDEDYARLAAVADIDVDDEKENVRSSFKKRMPWLVILLATDILTSSVVAGFENVLAAIPALALFMPLILSMCGNTGTQSLGVIIRLFAENRLEAKKDVWKHLFHEFLTGLVNGIVLGVIVFGLVLAMRMIGGETFATTFPIARVVALSIALALMVSTLAGAVVPLIAKLCRVDPAVASGPFITTINDILSLLIYFGLASLMLGSLL